MPRIKNLSRPPLRPRRAALLLAALCALGLAACAETKLSADEFLDEANGNGATVELGDQLPTEEEGKSLYEVTLRPLAPGTASGGGNGEGPGSHPLSGTLAVYEDTELADGGTQDCQAALEFLCYQAANVVVMLEGNGIEAARLAAAVEKMGD
ncbi:MAG: hypothetical protein EXQ70_00065 [Solirubrobacterales bacterium]|nr:hypothetical protein [Solirubrobacterales bacterium]